MAIDNVPEQENNYEDFWYAACVQHSCERIAESQIANIKVNEEKLNTWVAAVNEIHTLSRGKTKCVEHVLLPSFVFFRFPAKTSRDLKYDPILEVKKLTKVHHLVMSPDRQYGEWEGAHIPNIQIERMKFMLRMSDTPVDVDTKDTAYVVGNKVRIIRGSLQGLEGTIKYDDKGGDRIYITIEGICNVSTTISRLDVEYIRRRPGRPRKTVPNKSNANATT